LFLHGLQLLLSHLALGKTFFPVNIIRMGLSLYCLFDDVFHASSFCGWDPGVLKLDTVTQVFAVLGHG
jgi:hypothetical protein